MTTLSLRQLVAGAALAFAASAWLAPSALAARQSQEAQTHFGLVSLFDPAAEGTLLRDGNGDGVPDRLGATLVLPANPTGAERAAGAEIAARLGFETMALDLPLARGVRAGRVAVLIGLRALEENGLALADFAMDLPDSGEGAAGSLAQDGAHWLLVAGSDDDGLLRGARLLAGSLPHAGTLSGPSLAHIGDEIAEWMAAESTVQIEVVISRAVADTAGNVRLGGTLRFDPSQTSAADSAFARLEELAALRRDSPEAGPAEAGTAAEPDSAPLRFPRVVSVALSFQSRQVVLPTLAAPPPPGPVPGRPGSGGKDALDLSNVYAVGGLLADSDGNEIPDGIDAILVPDARAEGIPELAARLGLESTGITIPLVKRPDRVESPAREPVMVLVGLAPTAPEDAEDAEDAVEGIEPDAAVPHPAGDSAHALIAQLADSGKITLAGLPPDHGLIEMVPKAFGSKPSLVVTGSDRPSVTLATKRLAENFPHLGGRASDAPVFDDLERELWGTLSGHTPAGQAAIGLYKLDQIVAKLAGEVASAEVLVSLEKPGDAYEALVRERAQKLGADQLAVAIDNRDVQNAAVIFDDAFEIPSEVDRFRALVRDRVLPQVKPGQRVRLEARLSEPPAIRRALEEEVRRRLVDAGADPRATRVQVLSAFKQGFSWLRESVAPRLAGRAIDEIVIEFLRNDPPAEWPQQAIHTPVRWLHEIFPADEVLAAQLEIDPDQFRFEMVDSGPVYRVRATAPDGSTLLDEAFDPVWVLRPYFDRFQDYEHVRVTTGWVRAIAGSDTLANERIVTDPEWFWDRYQARTLPSIYDYVMERHEGNPRGGEADAPFFGTLEIDLALSEPEYRLGVDNEIVSTMDALHEELYFSTIEFFHLLGRNARGRDLTYPGRIIPVMRPKGDGGPGNSRIRFTGFATSRPAVVVRYETRDGRRGERRLDIPKIGMERPTLRRAVVAPGSPALPRLDLRVRVDSETDQRDSLLVLARGEQIDAQMISAEQVAATLANLAELRTAGVHADALAYEKVGEIGVWAEWSHEQDPESRVTAVLPANGAPTRQPQASDLLPSGWRWDGNRIVQWETPIPPDEGHQMMAKMSQTFDYASMYRAGHSYLGRPIWAMELISPVAATHWSRAKATTFKPTVIYSARQHANEVSSTSHVLRHAELLLTDSVQRGKLDKVNVIVHAFTNPDGAQLAYDLYTLTPDYILHAGYLGSLGMDVTSGSGQDFPIYPEARIRGQLWERWLPDIFLNPHGYPSHQVVQLFSEYTGLVRRGRVTERNWGFNKGWFMPGFGYLDDPAYPRHKDAAFKIRDYITRAINSNRDVFEMNQRSYARYRRYGAAFDPDVFRLPVTDSVLIEMPLKGARGNGGGRFNPRVTIWSGITEAPDETAYGDWMELVAKAGLSWDQAILDYLYDGNHQVKRTGSRFFGGVTLKMNRPRPPEPPDDQPADDQEPLEGPDPSPSPASPSSSQSTEISRHR